MLQIKILTHENQAEAISDFLFEQNAEAITFMDAENQSLFQLKPHEMHLWKTTFVIGLFIDEDTLKNVIKALTKQFQKIQYQIENVPEEDWVKKTQSDFKPSKFGEKLWVCPPWNTVNDPNALVVTLNPGIAFGTGTHPTTALCLEWLEKNIQGDETVIDYGCGSGILAIAACKLGAKEVWAIDHDKQALEATKANAKLNQLKNYVLHIGLPEEIKSIQADILIANILATPLIELKDKFTHLLKKHGKIAISGILQEQVDEIINNYNDKFSIDERFVREGWVLLSGFLL